MPKKVNLYHLALCICQKCNHSAYLKVWNSAHENKVKGWNNMTKYPCEAMLGLQKNITVFLDQLMLEGWANSVLPFSEHSHSRARKDKMLNVFFYIILSISLLQMKGRRRLAKNCIFFWKIKIVWKMKIMYQKIMHMNSI